MRGRAVGKIEAQVSVDIGARVGRAVAGKIALPIALAGDGQLMARPVGSERSLEAGLPEGPLLFVSACPVRFDAEPLAEGGAQRQSAEPHAGRFGIVRRRAFRGVLDGRLAKVQPPHIGSLRVRRRDRAGHGVSGRIRLRRLTGLAGGGRRGRVRRRRGPAGGCACRKRVLALTLVGSGSRQRLPHGLCSRRRGGGGKTARGQAGGQQA